MTAAAGAAGPSVSIPAMVRSVQRSASYLRHAPPSVYATIDPAGNDGDSSDGPAMRHATRLLDSAGTLASTHTNTSISSLSDGPALPLQTHGVYLLSSTTMDDPCFARADRLESILVGLPRVCSGDEAGAFVRAHEGHLAGVTTVLLPEISSGGAGHAVRALRRMRPDLVFCGSPFAKAFLTDPTFFDGARRTIMANDAVRAEAIPFAELPPEAFTVAEDEAVVGRSGGRRVTAHWAMDPRREERLRAARQSPPPHFHNQPVFYHDSAFEATLVGGAVCRLPWLPLVLTEMDRDGGLLPCPPLLAARRAAAGPKAPLLATWRPEEAAAALAATLRRVPQTQRILCESFGEVGGDADGIAAAVTDAAAALEALRSRLAARLLTDTGRDVPRWAALMHDRLLAELLCPNTASVPTAPATRAALRSWAFSEAAVATASPVAAVATTLAQAAFALPPSTEAAATAGGGAEPNQESGSGSAVQPPTRREQELGELAGAPGVALMKELLVKKGLGGLGAAVEKEEIDVTVFLAMTPEDFRRVLKATFGVSKRLEMLQQELRSKL